jgi:DNA-binding MarR family transcriptional regulator
LAVEPIDAAGFRRPPPSRRLVGQASEIRALLHRKASAARDFRLALASQLGVSESDCEALAQLASAGSLTPKDLGVRMRMSTGGTTRLIQRLEEAGHIVRSDHPTDGRRCVLRLSPATVDVAMRHYAPLDTAIDDISATLSDFEREAILKYLRRVVATSEAFAHNALAQLEPADTSNEPPLYL